MNSGMIEHLRECLKDETDINNVCLSKNRGISRSKDFEETREERKGLMIKRFDMIIECEFVIKRNTEIAQWQFSSRERGVVK